MSSVQSQSDVDAVVEKVPTVDVENVKPRAKDDNRPASPHPRAHMPTWKWVLLLVGLYTGAFLYGLDTTIAADVQGPVYETFHKIEDLPWVGLGFPMASVAVILLFGKGYTMFDVKSLLLSSLFIFEVGSALCGAAPSSAALIVGRVIAGAGGAGMYMGALTYVAVFSAPAEAMVYNALTGLTWGIGTIVGPIIGGAFSDSDATWRWAFYINLPLCGVLCPVYFLVFPRRNPRPDMSLREKVAKFDWLGGILNGAVLVIFMIVVSFSGSTYAWNSGSAIALWVVFAVTLVVYIAQQYFALFTTRENRIFPVHFLKSKSLVALYTATAGGSAAYEVTLYYIPLFLQFSRGDSAIKAALRLLPMICVFIFFVMVAGATLPLSGRYNLFYLVAGPLIVIGGALAFTIDANTNPSKVYGYEVLTAAGCGLMFQNAYAVATAKVFKDQESNALGFINVAQIGTMAFGLSIAGCLFQNLGFKSLKHDLASYQLPVEYVRSALAGRISPVFASADEQIICIAVDSVAKTISKLFGMVIAGGAVVLVSGVIMPFDQLDLGAVAGG